MNYEAMLKNVNTFGGLTSEAGIRDFFKPEVLDWYLNDKTGLYVILENGSFRASVPASDFGAALIFYANRIVSSALRREADPPSKGLIMNHRKCTEGLSLIPYSNRSYILGEIDDRVFDALNYGNHVVGLNGYCLDALEYMPSGSMVNCGSYAVPIRIDYTEREFSLAERLAMIAEVDAILKEADER